MAGFPGYIGSTNATHVIIERFLFRLRQLNLGYKLAYTARTYNMTVNHRNRILSTTKRCHLRFNDKTHVLYDDFVQATYNNLYSDKLTFFIKYVDSNGEFI